MIHAENNPETIHLLLVCNTGYTLFFFSLGIYTAEQVSLYVIRSALQEVPRDHVLPIDNTTLLSTYTLFIWRFSLITSCFYPQTYSSIA